MTANEKAKALIMECYLQVKETGNSRLYNAKELALQKAKMSAQETTKIQDMVYWNAVMEEINIFYKKTKSTIDGL